ncbi:MAG TPA: hypothetical protein VMI75_05900 [Polyangiaceae bacterium]|nr:hypothetical protein [Polyangiaceae bacterium]
MARLLSVVALTVVALVAIVTVREVAIGRAEVALCDAATQKSDWPEAIGHARGAAEALVPGSPWPEQGWMRLEAIGHDAEARGDDETALLAYGAMRAAAMATRAPGSGWARRRAQSEEALARVAGASRDPTGPHVTSDSMLEALHDQAPPAPWLLFALAASAIASLGALVRLAWLGDAAARARVTQGVAAIGFIAYALVALTT